MNKYYNNKEHNKNEKHVDKTIKKYQKKNLTTEEKIKVEQALQTHLATKTRLQIAEIPEYEYVIIETGEIIEITREHSLELKRKEIKIKPLTEVTEEETEEEELNTKEDISLAIDLTKVKREKWADKCWNAKNLKNTKTT